MRTARENTHVIYRADTTVCVRLQEAWKLPGRVDPFGAGSYGMGVLVGEPEFAGTPCPE